MDYYLITGTLTADCEESEDGFFNAEVEEIVTADDTGNALENFLQENPQYQFFGSLAVCDAETRGVNFAIYRDQNENQTLTIEKMTNI